MFLVGLTGGIATGKSTVSNMLRDMGCVILDADKIAREVVEPGERAWKKIHKEFGSEVLTADGTLDREKLGEIIFNDKTKRKMLNSITHPEIYRAMMWKVMEFSLKGEQFVVLDLPLLFETGNLLPYLSKVIVVTCNLEAQMERLQVRNDYSRESARKRIDAQLPLEIKCQRATDVIDNSGSVEDTLQQVTVLYQLLRRSKTHWKIRFFAFVILGSLLTSGCLLLKKFIS